jgi:hypothetical protein
MNTSAIATFTVSAWQKSYATSIFPKACPEQRYAKSAHYEIQWKSMVFCNNFAVTISNNSLFSGILK